MDPNPVRVLIVDDHRLFADSLRLLLDRDDTVIVVGVAGDGDEAVDLAVTHDAEVVLMDLSLPGCDGYEAARRLRGVRSATRVIALSGHEERDVAADVAAAGMIGFLSKDHIGLRVVAEIHAAAGR